MAGKGGRPKGGYAKHDTDDKTLPSQQTKDLNTFSDADVSTIKDAIHKTIVGNLDNLSGWLTEVGESSPKMALDIFMSLAEYVLPKQQRADANKNSTMPIQINFEPSSVIKNNQNQQPQQQQQVYRKQLVKPATIDDFIVK